MTTQDYLPTGENQGGAGLNFSPKIAVARKASDLIRVELINSSLRRWSRVLPAPRVLTLQVVLPESAYPV
jgi:hypothetical protein